MAPERIALPFNCPACGMLILQDLTLKILCIILFTTLYMNKAFQMVNCLSFCIAKARQQ
jgi:hypothetical protein